MAAGDQPGEPRKKLSRAGRAWAYQVLGRLDPEIADAGKIHPDAIEGLQAMGFTVDPADVDGGEDCTVRSDCFEAAVVFSLCATQWRWVAAGGGMAPAMLVRTGLDYTAVVAVMTAERIEASLADVGAIEAGALGVFDTERD